MLSAAPAQYSTDLSSVMVTFLFLKFRKLNPRVPHANHSTFTQFR